MFATAGISVGRFYRMGIYAAWPDCYPCPDVYVRIKEDYLKWDCYAHRSIGMPLGAFLVSGLILRSKLFRLFYHQVQILGRWVVLWMLYGTIYTRHQKGVGGIPTEALGRLCFQRGFKKETPFWMSSFNIC